MRVQVWAGAAAAILLLGSCGVDEPEADEGAVPTVPEGDPEEPPELPEDPPAEPPAAQQLERLGITASQITDTEFLTAIAWREDDPNPYLADQHGQTYQLIDGQAQPVLDLTAQVLDYEPGAEYGMLGLTVDPVDGRMIVGYNTTEVDTRIESYAVGDDGRPDPESAREILYIEQPGVGHNSGHFDWDEDGNLFISMGDGGGSSGADAQDMTKLLGGILRITPDRDGPGYTVPDDNPYVGQDGIAPEIWGKGMRNPWRFSIDHPTGDIWIGDVGNGAGIEAIYRVPAGEDGVNLGWPTFEGSQEIHYNPNVEPVVDPTMPVHEYGHDVGIAVIGGYVYRGSAIPELEGAYVFMDLTGPVWAMGAEGSEGVVQLDVSPGGFHTSFGQDPDGELYILTQQNGAFKLEPAP
jgi:hypothetical protein